MPAASDSDYGILGVPPSSPFSEVRSAFAARMKEVHPDRGGSPAEFTETMEAYRRIADSESAPVRHRVRVGVPLADMAAGCAATVSMGGGLEARFGIPPMTPSGTTLEFRADGGASIVSARVAATGEADAEIPRRVARKIADLCRRALTDSGDPAHLGCMEVPDRVILEFGGGAPALRIRLETGGMDR